LRDGDYADLKGVSLVMITAGVNEKTGGAIVPRLRAAEPQALVLVVTDPPDPLADAVRMLGHDRVLSTGTYLDSLRFRFHLARRLVSVRFSTGWPSTCPRCRSTSWTNAASFGLYNTFDDVDAVAASVPAMAAIVATGPSAPRHSPIALACCHAGSRR
jgi:hypothetical protein